MRIEIKLGEHKNLNNGGNIKEIWLTKNLATNDYAIMGYYRNEETGYKCWVALFSGTLRAARGYARKLIRNASKGVKGA